MKKKNKIIAAFIVMVILIASISMIRNIISPERKIKKFVIDNRTELTEIAENYLNSDTDTKTYKGVEVEQVFMGTNDIVQFFYSGVGIAPASKYYGFYYSPNDAPAAYQNIDMNLTETSDNEWKWEEKGTDNGGRTVKIMENWFYYEAWF